MITARYGGLTFAISGFSRMNMEKGRLCILLLKEKTKIMALRETEQCMLSRDQRDREAERDGGIN